MSVKGEPGHRRTQAERRAGTRAALIDAARELFADRGFVATGREEIAARAGVTRGALYHHFASKEDLFRAVYEQIEAELMEAIIVAAAAAEDPIERLRLGAAAFLDAAVEDPAVGRVVLVDAPSVLPADARRELAKTYGLGVTIAVLAEAMDAERMSRQPVELLAPIVLAALHQAAELVAGGADRKQVGKIVEHMIEGL